jgi:hypothetical protein
MRMTRSLAPRHGAARLLGRWVAALLAALVWAAQPARAAPPQVDAVEPPYWWVGMAERRLQLLVYGPDIAQAQVSVGGSGLALERVQRTGSPHHLFLHLRVAADARPGTRRLSFERQGERHTVAYTLKPREPGSAQRRGFEGRDVLLNLMPDRFASGDTSNDTVPGMGDPVDRAAVGGRHGGDLQGVIERLDYLAGMGFTAIWLTPVVEVRQPAYSYHGYAATDLYRVDPRLGTLDDYRRLGQEARRHGLGLIHDAVPNHIGSAHRWRSQPPASGRLNPAPPEAPLTHHARNTVRDAYAAPADRARCTCGWFAPAMLDLDTTQPLLAQYLVQNAIWWIEEIGLKGLRVDTWGYSDPGFLARWAARLRQEYPRLGLVGEEWSLNPLVVSAWQAGRRRGRCRHRARSATGAARVPAMAAPRDAVAQDPASAAPRAAHPLHALGRHLCVRAPPGRRAHGARGLQQGRRAAPPARRALCALDTAGRAFPGHRHGGAARPVRGPEPRATFGAGAVGGSATMTRGCSPRGSRRRRRPMYPT